MYIIYYFIVKCKGEREVFTSDYGFWGEYEHNILKVYNILLENSQKRLDGCEQGERIAASRRGVVQRLE